MAEVKDLENVEQEATAPAMEETAADSAAQLLVKTAHATAQAAGRIICRANPTAIPTRPFSTWPQSSPLLFFTTRTTRLRASMAFRTSP